MFKLWLLMSSGRVSTDPVRCSARAGDPVRCSDGADDKCAFLSADQRAAETDAALVKDSRKRRFVSFKTSFGVFKARLFFHSQPNAASLRPRVRRRSSPEPTFVQRRGSSGRRRVSALSGPCSFVSSLLTEAELCRRRSTGVRRRAPPTSA